MFGPCVQLVSPLERPVFELVDFSSPVDCMFNVWSSLILVAYPNAGVFVAFFAVWVSSNLAFPMTRVCSHQPVVLKRTSKEFYTENPTSPNQFRFLFLVCAFLRPISGPRDMHAEASS